MQSSCHAKILLPEEFYVVSHWNLYLLDEGETRYKYLVDYLPTLK
jgi:hypothetical protein